MVAPGRTVVSLPLLTKVGDHTKRTECLACADAYQTLPYLTPRQRNPLVFLDWSTNAYQSADLGRNLPSEAFTNHYHRDRGLGIDLSVGEVVYVM